GTSIGDLDENGIWRGLFPDFCRVVAAALSGNAERVEFVQLAGRSRMQAVRSGDVDIVMQNATDTLTREGRDKAAFPAIYYYDDQGFMVHAAFKARTLRDLQGLERPTVCALTGTTAIERLRDLSATTLPGVQVVPVDTMGGYVTAF